MLRKLLSSSHSARLVVLALGLDATAIPAQGRDRTPPTAPSNLAVAGTTQNSVSLTWSPSSDNSGRFNYLINVAGMTVTVGQGQTSYTVTGLQSGRTYTIRVYAKDLSGNLSRSSNAVTVTLQGQVAAPTKPVVNVLEVGPTHVRLSYSSTDDGPYIWYTIYIDGQQVMTLNSKTATFTCASVMVPTLCDPIDQETTYTFTVRARDIDGNYSQVSDPVVVTTQAANPNDQTPPTPVTNLAAENTGGFHLISWSPSSDDFAPRSLIRYDVYVNGELRAVVVGQTSVEVELDFGDDSLVTVVAIDTADNESDARSIIVSS